MTIYDLILISILLLPALLIWQNAAFRDRAMGQARRYCESMDVQLLDDTVELVSLRPGRDSRGNWGLQRSYQFAFTSSGDARYLGHLRFHGRHLISASLQPHRI